MSNQATIPVVYDPRYIDLDQFAARLEDGRAFVICVPYEKSRPTPRSNDLVLVERTKNDLSELLLCVTIYGADRTWTLRTQDPPHLELPMSSTNLTIVGLCIGRYQTL